MHNQRPTVDAFEPAYRLEPEILERMRRIERMDADLGGLQADTEVRQALLRDALSYNAFGTASIEGNPMSLAEVRSLLAAGPTPEAMRIPDEREILNWSQFMQALEDHPVPRDVAGIEALHATLFEGVMDERHGVGRLKDKPNYIGRRDGTVIYVPTPPERAPLELQNALDWFHESDAPPLIRTWLFHHEFEAIHPFLDGNGRLGRALMTMALHGAGYTGVRYALVDYAFNADRQSYYDALNEAGADRDFTPWLRYLSGVFEEAYIDAVRRLTLGRDGRLNARQAQIATWFLRITSDAPKRRVKFADIHAAFPQSPRRTLQEDIKSLVAQGFLLQEGQRKGTTYGVAYRGDTTPSSF